MVSFVAGCVHVDTIGPLSSNSIQFGVGLSGCKSNVAAFKCLVSFTDSGSVTCGAYVDLTQFYNQGMWPEWLSFYKTGFCREGNSKLSIVQPPEPKVIDGIKFYPKPSLYVVGIAKQDHGSHGWELLNFTNAFECGKCINESF